MLYLDDPGLDAATAQGLGNYQKNVDSACAYAERVETGKELFTRYNRRENRVFRVVREQLATMCYGARRCCYCEDSVGDEIEHIKPKDLLDYVPSSSALRTRNAIVLESSSETENRRPSGRKRGFGAA